MTAQEARQIIAEAVTQKAEICKQKGFLTGTKVYYSDKALRECTEFNENVILLFGAVKLGLEGMDEEDYCTYGLCCETKLGMVDDEELNKEIEDFNKDVDKMLEEILSSPSPAEKIVEINARQEKEAMDSMSEFNREMRKMKLKLYSALGILGVIAAAIIIAGFII